MEFYVPEEVMRGVTLMPSPAVPQQMFGGNFEESMLFHPLDQFHMLDAIKFKASEGEMVMVEVPDETSGLSLRLHSPPHYLLQHHTLPSDVSFDDCFHRIESYLTSKCDLSSHFNSYDGKWNCQQSSPCGTMSFNINLFQNEDCANIVMELQHLQGDRWNFGLIRSEVQALFLCGLKVGNSESVAPPSCHDDGDFLYPDELVERLNCELKHSIIDDLKAGAYSKVVTAVQMVMAIYEDKRSSARHTLIGEDFEIMHGLLDILADQSFCDDNLNHLVLNALVTMTEFEQVCDRLLHFQDGKLCNQLLDFAQGEGPYNNESARKNCARMVGNLLSHTTNKQQGAAEEAETGRPQNLDTTALFADRNKLEIWLNSSFAKGQLGEEAATKLHAALLLAV